MLEKAFNEVYDKFKLNFYRNIFTGFEKREATLTAIETFCTEVIYALDRPTINEVGKFLRISQPNITYKVNNLVKKGYVKKVQSEEDKREYFLELTDKFYKYNNIRNEYMDIVLRRAKNRFTKEEVDQLERMLYIISDELMPEVTEGVEKIKTT
ncbi:DNA-binding transcriptional regulator, MarR family [Anaerosphaera aminiphila DSM 21120]|uniref:DNA-binding transcriptional regulator, MarR family n=1 Tax=Anaerosphaera aminiphila DSM 21120 TaxID=1120995 RepID=A0A1M5U0S9_9FIRM|nr:winged helix DNA-binding protein [Anaerosphaera aminiphila]SHH56632.1 DNA-binding transcriptional regulator, MarR family [Anaerosphaera aminiphila DSM 21120]